MTQIEKMIKAQGDWQKIFNALVDVVSDGGTVKHVSNVVSFSNGVTASSNDIYYIDLLNGYRLVYLSIKRMQATDYPAQMVAFQLPQGFIPVGGSMMITLNEKSAAGPKVDDPSSYNIFIEGAAWQVKQSFDWLNVGATYLATIQ